jgi:UDP-N-acetylmuramoyl-tripeptide--D-alanyl-D-alanine ligase
MSGLWTAAELLEATGGRMDVPFAASGIAIDTRRLAPGEMFIALRGAARDGHAFVADALARGAAGAMVSSLPAGVPPGAPLLVVDDTLAGLTRLGAFARARFGGRLVAVTGSVGKTTSKEMLRAILAAHGPTHAAEASFNNQWGVPVTLARLPRAAAWCVVEIGMNHAGEILPLARLARPHVVLITNIEKAHIGHLGSLEAIADEKASIAGGLEPGGVAVLPADSPLLARLRAACGAARIITFGAGAAADARLLDAAVDAEGTVLEARVAGRTLRTRLAAPGRHMAVNAVGAIAAAVALGADPVTAAEALRDFAPIAGRGARRRILLPGGGSVLLLDESYNASVPSVRAALAVLRLQPARRRIAVLGDMRELGAEGPGEHRALAPDVVAHADLLFTCGDLMGLLHEAVPADRRGAHAADAEALAPVLAAALRPGDAVLVKGSLGSRMAAVIAALEALQAPAGAGAG